MAAASFARTQWTQFNGPLMAAGLAVFCAAFGVQVVLLVVRAMNAVVCPYQRVS